MKKFRLFIFILSFGLISSVAFAEDEAEEENISENADNKKVVTSKAEVLVVVEEGDNLVKARNKGKNKQKKKTFANNKKSRASKKNKGKGRGRSKE